MSGATQKCGSCRTAMYCDRTCQTESWNEHKSKCKELKRLKLEAEIHDFLQDAYEDTSSVKLKQKKGSFGMPSICSAGTPKPST